MVYSYESSRLIHTYFNQLLIEGCAQGLGKRYGAPIFVVGRSSKEFFDYFYQFSDSDYQGQDFLLLYLKQPARLTELRRWLQTAQAKTLLLINQKFKNVTNLTLAHLYRGYIKYWKKYFYINNVVRLLDLGLRVYLAKRNWFGLEPSDWAILAAPKQPNVITVEQRYFLSLLASKLKRKIAWDRAVRQTAESAWRKFAWVPVSYHSEPPRTLAYYIKMANRLRRQGIDFTDKLREVEREHERLMLQQMKLRRHLANKEARLVVKLLQEATFIKDNLRLLNSRLIYEFEPQLKRLAKCLKLPLQLFKQLTPAEVLKTLQGRRMPKRLLRTRFLYNVTLYRNGRCVFLYGRQAKAFAKHNLCLPAVSGREMQGRVASQRGIVHGRAVLIHGPADFKKFKPGDIIVTSNTNPSFVPLLRRCAALLCEEGGLTIHAAIISRELGIPCLVGLRGLLHWVRNKDMLEVDSLTGRVRKIKKSRSK